MRVCDVCIRYVIYETELGRLESRETSAEPVTHLYVSAQSPKLFVDGVVGVVVVVVAAYRLRMLKIGGPGKTSGSLSINIWGKIGVMFKIQAISRCGRSYCVYAHTTTIANLRSSP